TASSKALRKIQQEWLPLNNPSKRVLGVVIPMAEQAVEQSRCEKIGIIGTQATIESGAYQNELRKINPKIKVFKKAAPLLVPLVESDWLGRPETKMILKKYLRPLKNKKIDTLILGCTHYPFLERDIKKNMGKKVNIISAPDIVADKFQNYLNRHPEIKSKLDQQGKRLFYTTDDKAQFKLFAKKYLKIDIENIKKVAFVAAKTEN
ncbi:MAG: aspartate/glutamate racemase family protein, partial [Patescibacteria group bacterium]|nr:aspartate/glutamate racemase family protein [Patescibacteria group bacterium]